MNPYRKRITAALLATLTALGAATATGQPITIDTVTVGYAGNAGDPDSNVNRNGYGAVAYEYQIGKYEVTNAQYVAFLNAVAATDTYGLYHANMDATIYGGITRAGTPGSYTYTVKGGWGNKPVNFVSFYSAARFTNWLTNGQKTGAQDATTTESGLYVFSGATTLSLLPDHATSTGWVIPTEDEWYKAAYYNPTLNGGAGGYTNYPWAGGANPVNDTNAVNGANFNNSGNVTDVGSYTKATSYFGTYDQGGNLWEWNDTIFSGGNRAVMGGSFFNNLLNLSTVYRRDIHDSAEVSSAFGIRVAYLTAVPEPEAAPATLSEPEINGSTITINVIGTAGNYYALYASQNLLGNAASWGFVSDTAGQFDSSGLATLTFTRSAAPAEFYRVVTSASPLDGVTINDDSKFSYDVDGVYDVTVAAKGKAYVANQFVQTTNTVAALFDTLARGSSVAIQNASTGGMITVTKNTLTGSWGANGSLVVDTGTAVLVSNFATTPVTLSFTGVVATGTRTSTSIAGINTCTASPFPVSASTEDFGIVRTRGDTVIRLMPDGSALTYTVNSLTGNWGSTGAPVPGIGEGFLFRHAAAAAWNKTLTLSTDSMEITW
ncbi:SUMF1/EgtB/PvdO family nonheme iron enzyme [Geminisphaera colitermitum]|uniref:SUMF1/EgtB/PvdO family nonheme iron enzyme n=1 Tax=Geminisphaera colitermitum TaxID=1148786 RepID=UPI000158D065|nr:SUMF1/EgtB/PvdO family nonheme iron enzyme [Geminisphaera colitermitum]